MQALHGQKRAFCLYFAQKDAQPDEYEDYPADDLGGSAEFTSYTFASADSRKGSKEGYQKDDGQTYIEVGSGDFSHREGDSHRRGIDTGGDSRQKHSPESAEAGGSLIPLLQGFEHHADSYIKKHDKADYACKLIDIVHDGLPAEPADEKEHRLKDAETEGRGYYPATLGLLQAHAAADRHRQGVNTQRQCYQYDFPISHRTSFRGGTPDG